MRIPETLKFGPPRFLTRIPDHDTKRNGHYPTGGTGSGEKISSHKAHDAGIGLDGKLSEVDHMSSNVKCAEEGQGKACELVKGDVLLKRDNMIESWTTKEGDEVSTDG